MEIKCPSCGGILEYDVVSDKMLCKSCGNKYDGAELAYMNEKNDTYQTSDTTHTNDNINDGNYETYDTFLCKCESCGAQLFYASKTEVTSVCAFCGNRSVNFDRVEKSRKPDYIIPFKISKEKAVSLLRGKVKKSIFAPKDFRNIQFDRVVGVYVPFFTYDIYMYEEMDIEYVVSTGKTTTTKRTFRVADAQLDKMTLDASRFFNDNSSRSLEPYDMAFLKEFSPAYLSGYFADKYDMTQSEMDKIADIRSFQLFRDGVFKTVEGSNKKVLAHNSLKKVQNVSYIMLPVWFMTVRYEDNVYTMMVNGQTGKVVGTIPYDSGKLVYASAAMFGLLSLLCVPFFGFFCKGEIGGSLIGMAGAGLAGSVVAGTCFYRKFKKDFALTTSSMMRRYAKERQDR